MPAKRKILNVRTHLEHIALTIRCFEKYGDCEEFRRQLKTAEFFNKKILAAHKASGSRKDLYVGVKEETKQLEEKILRAKKLLHSAGCLSLGCHDGSCKWCEDTMQFLNIGVKGK